MCESQDHSWPQWLPLLDAMDDMMEDVVKKEVESKKMCIKISFYAQVKRWSTDGGGGGSAPTTAITAPSRILYQSSTRTLKCFVQANFWIHCIHADDASSLRSLPTPIVSLVSSPGLLVIVGCMQPFTSPSL